MKRLPAAKRNQLIMVVAITVALIGLVYFVLIRPQNEQNKKLAGRITSEQAKLQEMQNGIKQADLTSNKLSDVSLKLSHAEEDVASGDVYAWLYNTISRFKSSYKVEIPSIGQPAHGVVDLIPDFPYEQVKVTINGSAYYHDLGRFIADFENNFPHIRIVNLYLEPTTLPNAALEKLNFRFDVIALVKPTK